MISDSVKSFDKDQNLLDKEDHIDTYKNDTFDWDNPIFNEALKNLWNNLKKENTLMDSCQIADLMMEYLKNRVANVWQDEIYGWLDKK